MRNIIKKINNHLKKALGPIASNDQEIIAERDQQNAAHQERIDELKQQNAADQQNAVVQERIDERNQQISTIREGIGMRNEENERLQERMPLKEWIKEIFKKYGFTTIAVVSAVGVVIGVIVSYLKAGLTKVAKGLGDGLKDIGKKLANLFPGMIGAIASFIFRTAGEAIGFLAKNAWLFIVAVLVYFVEEFKKKRR